MTTLILRSLRTSTSSTTITSVSSSCSPFSIPTPLLLSSSSSTRNSLRHASTTKPFSSTAAIRSSSTTSSTINGPSSTRPPKLELPTRGKDEPFFFKYALKLGKAYGGFYKTGAKSIYANYQAAKPIQRVVQEKSGGSREKAARDGRLTRRDFQLLVRNTHDVRRVPIFALVFLVCGEFTPLVVIALTGVVPWTCRIPKQIDGDRRKLETRRRISFRNLTAPPPRENGVDELERMQLLHISWSLGLSSSMWDWLGGQYPGLPTWVLRRKVAARVNYLDLDDRLLGKPENVKHMDTEEVSMALVERGIDVLGKDDKSLRSDLASWLKSRQKAPVERLLLTR
ncbi:hypothetical protein PVAG01_03063 [Phlyctema vagabunda]|uniref:Letm1 RBD domain-containing protein n=1 Tax=Phlyctema vagabunda TaxID=108571 RepID=A0ABR4PSF4_9HELO